MSKLLQVYKFEKYASTMQSSCLYIYKPNTWHHHNVRAALQDIKFVQILAKNVIIHWYHDQNIVIRTQ